MIEQTARELHGRVLTAFDEGIKLGQYRVRAGGRFLTVSSTNDIDGVLEAVTREARNLDRNWKCQVTTYISANGWFCAQVTGVDEDDISVRYFDEDETWRFVDRREL